MKYTIIRGCNPPKIHNIGTWQFMEQGIPVGGSTVEELIEKIATIRAENHQPPGNPLEEYTNWLCTQYPQQCSFPGGTGKFKAGNTPRQQSQGEQWTQAVGNWLKALKKKPAQPSNFVEDDTIAARASICNQCPNNRLVYCCAANKRAIDEASLLIRQNKKIPFKLGGCHILCQENNAGVTLKENILPSVSDDVNVMLPDVCWRKRKE